MPVVLCARLTSPVIVVCVLPIESRTIIVRSSRNITVV